MEAESPVFLIDRIRGVYFLQCSIDLQIIIVYDETEVVQFMVAGEHGRLPDLAFLELSVTEDRVCAI